MVMKSGAASIVLAVVSFFILNLICLFLISSTNEFNYDTTKDTITIDPATTTIVDIDIDIDFDYNPNIIGIVDEQYVSFTLDWWPWNAGSPFPPPYGWGNHSNVLDIDLQHPKLRALVAALGPSILRIGGTLDKIVEYDIPDEGVYCSSPKTTTAATTTTPSPPCLNMSRWDGLHEFASNTNTRIVFGLSYPTTGEKEDEGRWDSTQATALMKYSKQQNYTRETTLFGFELGEELTKYEAGTTAFTNYIEAYHECSYLLKSVYDFHEDRRRPLLMGPCPGMSWPRLATWFPSFLNATKNMLDVAVYHSYNQIEYPNKLYLNTTIPSGNMSAQNGSSPGDTGWQATAMKRFVDDVNNDHETDSIHNMSLWLGEMGPHNGGGGSGNISSSFASSFGYIDTLGTLARLDHKVLSRQTLVGGKYELLRCNTGIDGNCDFEPQPDYWVAFLWTRLMGTVVLEPPGESKSTYNHNAVENEDWKDHLHFHLHCTAGKGTGSITLAFSNLSYNSTFVIPVSHLGRRRIEYILQGYSGSDSTSDNILRSRTVTLNGNILHMGDTTQLPDLRGRQVFPSESVMIPPLTLGFIVFPYAGVFSCMDRARNPSVMMK
jgi:heparanase 1